MQRKRPPPAQRQIWTILLILALLVLFVLTVGTSCTASPHLYGGRGQDCEVSLLYPESKLF